MRKLFVKFLRYLTKNFDEDQIITSQPEEINKEVKPPPIEAQIFANELKEASNKPVDKPKKKSTKNLATIPSFDPRDIVEIMEIPFVALSKNRTAPIIYESSDGRSKVKISCHTEHYIASIYDFDIVLLAASKMQEFINSASDAPPRTLVIPRNVLLKALHKHDGKKEEKDLKASLARLRLTGIETTIRNEDGRYDAGFGFLDSWGYTDRKDVKEIKITLSQWLYDGISNKGSLLKVSPEYFTITSGIKKFLYRIARKHVGSQNESWKLPLERLYEKSASEQDIRKFKYDLKKAVLDNDIPNYFLEWIEEDNTIFVRFINKKKELRRILIQSEDKSPTFIKKNNYKNQQFISKK